jgi:hypothetical protein
VSNARRAFGPVADHAGNAASARSAIATASATVIARAVDATSPVIGLNRSNVIAHSSKL